MLQVLQVLQALREPREYWAQQARQDLQEMMVLLGELVPKEPLVLVLLVFKEPQAQLAR